MLPPSAMKIISSLDSLLILLAGASPGDGLLHWLNVLIECPRGEERTLGHNVCAVYGFPLSAMIWSTFRVRVSLLLASALSYNYYSQNLILTSSDSR